MRQLLYGAAGGLLVWATFFGGASGDGRLFWIGAAALAVVAVAGVALPRPVVGSWGVAFLALLGGFVLWNGLSIAWSVEGDRSWSYLNRGLVYLAFVLLGALLGRPRAVAGGLALLLGAVLLWALAGKVVPGLFPDGARLSRLRNPVGYWNALALLADISLPLFLWLAARRRDLAALGVYLALVALLLTYSRAGLAVGVVAVTLWVWFDRRSLSVLAVAVPAALVVGAVGLALPGVAKDLQPHSVRVSDGAWFGLALVVGAIAVALVARRDVGRTALRVLAVVSAALILGGVGALAAQGSFLGQFRGSGVTHTASSENRLSWWGEAWRVFERAPAGGKGAGSFEVARTPVRHSATVTTEPHNVALQFLAETGVFGLLLGAAAALAALVLVWRVVRRLEGPERAAAAALGVAVPVYLLHALVDIDWDFVAVSAPVFFVVGVLIGTGEPRGRRSLLGAGVLVVGVLAAGYSLLAPWLADRRVSDAYGALGTPAAVADARSAHSWNPLSLEAYRAWALAEDALGNPADALRLYRREVALQPENATTWFDLGQFELEGLRDLCHAYDALNQAYTLDPWGPAGLPGGLLDQARAVRNSGRCR